VNGYLGTRIVAILKTNIPGKEILYILLYLDRLFSGEEVSVCLVVYTLGLQTDQTPPICASKRNTTGKDKTEWVPKMANSGKRNIKEVRSTTLNQTRSGGMKPWRSWRSWQPALERWDIAVADWQKVFAAKAEK
jgi:hypothetical protein